MKAPKLIKLVKQYISADKKKQSDDIKCFKDILKKLKKKENSLKDKLKKESDKKSRLTLEKQLSVIHAQRKKGIEAIKKAKNQ
ncbi:MAG: hypothetical protein HQL46_13745 [Gammaproteobacteria bacterium]|nr:hypothetical protein [Gammaproteobacteria bacterium]